MTFVIPDSKTTAADRLGYCVAAQEKLRRVHNEQSAKLKPQAMRQWIKGSFQPYSLEIARELLACRAEAEKALAEGAAALVVKGGQVVYHDTATWAQKFALADVAVRQLAEDDLSDKAAALSATRETLKFDPPTEALDEIVLPALDQQAETIDPYEDFTGFTESDPDGVITIDSSTLMTGTAVGRGDGGYTYKDYTAAHFGTSFEHLLETACSSADTTSLGPLWAVANTVGERYSWAVTNSEAVEVHWSKPSGLALYIRDFEDDSSDSSSGLATGTAYYLTVTRSSGTIACYLRTGSHAGSLVDTISTTISSSRTYRYLQGIGGWGLPGSGGAAITYTLSNLDLQEATTYDLTADDAAHAQSADSPTLEHVHELIGNDAAHAHAVGEPVLSRAAPGPYRVVAGHVWHTGEAAAATFSTGACAGDVFHTGEEAGRVR